MTIRRSMPAPPLDVSAPPRTVMMSPPPPGTYGIGSDAAGDGIVAGAAGDDVGAAKRINEVVAVPGRGIAGGDRVGTAAADDGVRANAGGDGVDAGTGVYHIVAAAEREGIVAGARENRKVFEATHDRDDAGAVDVKVGRRVTGDANDVGMVVDDQPILVAGPPPVTSSRKPLVTVTTLLPPLATMLLPSSASMTLIDASPERVSVAMVVVVERWRTMPVLNPPRQKSSCRHA